MNEHTPVLLEAALELLAIRAGGLYVDATFGAGGHSQAILDRLHGGRLVAVDADPRAAAIAEGLRDPRLLFVRANFRELGRVLEECGARRVDGVLFDVGVSSMQLDDPQRGFSVRSAAPPDMRMNPQAGRSAYDILTTASERELTDIFSRYGQERSAKRIARTIVHRRNGGALPQTAAEFAALVAGIVQRSGRRERLHPATRVFQALRIAVNDELDALRDGLEQAVGHLKTGGRIAVISFHSLEDRIVKHALRDDARLTVLTRRPLRPDEREIARNPRARSAKLRAAERKENL